MILRERVAFRIPRAGLWAITLLALVTLPSFSQSPDNPVADPFAAPTGGAPTGPVIPAGQAENNLVPNIAPAVDSLPDPFAMPQDGQASTNEQLRNDQLRNLEAQLQQLLSQVQSLQPMGSGGMPGAGGGSGGPMLGAGMPMGMGSIGELPGMMMGSMGAPGALPAQAIEIVETVEVKVFRTTYRLPEDKAAAVQAFVQQQFQSSVETRLTGNTLIVVTHSEYDQETMRRFIYLMLGQQPPETQQPGASGPASGATTLGSGSLPLIPN